MASLLLMLSSNRIEMKDKKNGSTTQCRHKGALEEGIVAGGRLRARGVLSKLKETLVIEDEKTGIDIPIRHLVNLSGGSPRMLGTWWGKDGRRFQNC